MMSKQVRVENERLWRTRVAQASHYEGGKGAYCRLHGISRGALRYWEKKIGAQSSGRSSRAQALPLVRPFVEVEVGSVMARPALPDPRWVAELIIHLSRRGAR